MGKSLKIILFGPAPPFRGGISDTQVHLGESLQQLGHRVELWTFSKQYPAWLFPGKTQKTEHPASSDLKIIEKVHGYAPLQWLSVQRALRKASPDLVIFRYWTPLFACCWATIGWNLSKSITKIGLVDNWLPHEYPFIATFINPIFQRAVDSFMCLSPFVAKQLKASTAKPVQWKLHPLPLQTPASKKKAQARETLAWPKDKIILVFVGLIRDYKGLELLIEALGKVVQATNKAIELRVGGAFYSPLEDYQSQIQQWGIEEQVFLQDQFLSPEALRDYICAADVVILPYKRASQSGIIAQAMHYQSPLMVSRVGGLEEQLQNYPYGTVVDPTSDAFSRAIAQVEPKKEREEAIGHPVDEWKAFATELLRLTE